MFNKLKQLFNSVPAIDNIATTAPAPEASPATESPKSDTVQVKKPRKKRVKKEETETPTLSAKELATSKNEPYVAVVKVIVDPNNVNNGAFELDWNEKFVMNCIRAGYKLKETDTEADVVDRWFVETCRNVALEVHEQYMADPSNRNNYMRHISSKDIGGGRTEIE